MCNFLTQAAFVRVALTRKARYPSSSRSLREPNAVTRRSRCGVFSGALVVLAACGQAESGERAATDASSVATNEQTSTAPSASSTANTSASPSSAAASTGSTGNANSTSGTVTATSPSGGNSSTDGPMTSASETSAPTQTATSEAASTSPSPTSEVITGAITDIEIEANPNSVLSAYVSWTTASPGTSRVQFGAGKLQWEVEGTADTTEHRVLIIGMRAETAYDIRVFSTTAEGTLEGSATFTTLALPAEIPVGEITAYDVALAQPGWTLMNVQVGQGDYRARSDYPPMAVMYDEEGFPVWYFISGNTPDIGGAVSTELTDEGVLLGPQMQGGASPREANFAGEITWQCDDPRCGGTSDLSHHAGKLPNGNFVVNRDVASGSVTMPVFQEFMPPNNDVVWELDLRSVLPPIQGASGDWCHGNSLTVHAQSNEVYVSCRFLGVIKTTYDNPSLIWHLPAAYGASGMGDFTFDPPESQFSDIHDPEIHDDGTVMVFDNGGWAGALGEYNPTGLKSRVVEYALDIENGIAKRVWEFPGTFEVDPWYRNEWYQPFWGDANRLANRNVLMTGGVRGPNLRSRVFEATDDGKVVWEFQLPADYGLYRATRVTPPLVRRLP